LHFPILREYLVEVIVRELIAIPVEQTDEQHSSFPCEVCEADHIFAYSVSEIGKHERFVLRILNSVSRVRLVDRFIALESRHVI